MLLASFMQFNREKMRAVILHACHSCDPDELGAVKLNKVLYYLDMIAYAHHRMTVTGATYRKRPNGPASDQLLFLLREMQRAGDIEIKDVDYHGFWKKEYIAKAPDPVGVLNEEELSLLDDVIEFVCRQHSARSISEYSHSLPWEMAEMGGVIPYHSAMLLFPMEPTPEGLEIAEQGLQEIAKARSSTNTVGLPLLRDFRSRILSEAGQGRS
jgi:Protein of unknown function (DUF4065)